MLQIFSVFGDESGAKLGELLAELWDDLRADEIFDRAFRALIGVDIYIKL